jgi:hypothetical protein
VTTVRFAPESVTQLLNGQKTSPETQHAESPLRAAAMERAMPLKILVLALLIANLTNLMCLVGRL